MDLKFGIRFGAVAFVTLVIAAGLVELARDDVEPAQAAPRRTGMPEFSDPLRNELRRCQLLGEAGPRDAACLEAWASSRDRFLGGGLSKPPVKDEERLGVSPAASGPAPAQPSSSTATAR